MYLSVFGMNLLQVVSKNNTNGSCVQHILIIIVMSPTASRTGPTDGGIILDGTDIYIRYRIITMTCTLLMFPKMMGPVWTEALLWNILKDLTWAGWDDPESALKGFGEQTHTYFGVPLSHVSQNLLIFIVKCHSFLIFYLQIAGEGHSMFILSNMFRGIVAAGHCVRSFRRLREGAYSWHSCL